MQPTEGFGQVSPGSDRPPPRKSWFQRALLPVALVSVFIAVIAVGVAIYTVRSRPDDPPTVSAGGTSTPAPSNTQTIAPTDTAAATDTGVPSDTETSTDSPLPPPPSDTSTVQPTGTYVLAYQGTRMVVPCGGTRVDLDQPRVDVNSASDFNYCGFFVNNVPAISTEFGHAILKNANATPDECERTIQLAPTTGGFATKAGLVYCQLTDGTQAIPGGGSSPKTCIIAITSITPDRSLNLSVSCYTNPT